ncbi:HK97 family phage prohead protease [Microbulbifer sp. S227A]|uniref:HK97 family phage prohead protease n=1 Tax=Microbulbifer sp. S227A TaxID=3415131 RepID=UPI003C7C66D5
MLWGGNKGTLEVRAEGGSTRLTARFPYGSETELAPGRLEVIAPRAFADRINGGDEIHLLAGHSYDKPLASRSAGTLTLTDTDEALEISATLDDGTTWARDFLAAHGSGLIKGLSPGFRVPQGGERIERRGASMLRTIHKADLFELSAVTKPAYPAAQIEARAWGMSDNITTGLHRTLNRWRA